MSNAVLAMPCFCGSHLDYQDCCHRFHAFNEYPETAAQLMRSRYSAFACLGNANVAKSDLADWLNYLEKTHENTSSSPEESAQLDQFAKQNNWLGLRIIGRSDGQKSDHKGTVEFIAIYRPKQNQPTPQAPSSNASFVLHEKSRFKRVDGKWMYIEGDIYPTTPSQAKTISSRISRNDLCWCDSGKKRKKCHPD